MSSPFLDTVLPLPAPPEDRYIWAVVTQASPLRIKIDGDRTALGITPDTLVSGLRVDQRVYCQIINRRLVVLGASGGAYLPGGFYHPQVAITESTPPTDIPRGIWVTNVGATAWSVGGAWQPVITVCAGGEASYQEIRGRGDNSTWLAGVWRRGGVWNAGGAHTWGSWRFVPDSAWVDAKTWSAATDLTGTIADGVLPTRLQGTAQSVTDWNSAEWTGFYRGNSASNAPGSSSWYYAHVIRHDSSYIVQTAYDYFNNNVYFRRKAGGAWQAWVQISDATDVIDSTSVFSWGSGFSAYASGGWGGIKVNKQGRMVVVSGAGTHSSSWAAGATLLTLNSGYRPSYRVVGASNAGDVSVYSDGRVTMDTAGSSAFRVHAAFMVP